MTTGDLWIGYTQASHWQIYNSRLSEPFRETDYEPEAILAFRTNLHVLGWDGRLLSASLTHQSNGRNIPLSRSWNRVILTAGFERPGWTLLLRPWWRIPDSAGSDDNPDIQNYMGRGEVLLVRHLGKQELSLLVRHSLRFGSASHGAAQFEWAFPISGNLHEIFQQRIGQAILVRPLRIAEHPIEGLRIVLFDLAHGPLKRCPDVASFGLHISFHWQSPGTWKRCDSGKQVSCSSPVSSTISWYSSSHTSHMRLKNSRGKIYVLKSAASTGPHKMLADSHAIPNAGRTHLGRNRHIWRARRFNRHVRHSCLYNG